MARGRIIDKAIYGSRKVSFLNDREALLYTWFIPITDDFGRAEGDADEVLSAVFRRRNVKEKEVEKILKKLWDVKLIRTYHVDDRRYIEIIDFDRYQTFRTDRKKQAHCPVPKFYDTTWVPSKIHGIPLETNDKICQRKEAKEEKEVNLVDKGDNSHKKDFRKGLKALSEGKRF